ncbi:MAG: N-acetylmuramoyl-L-alanine amidase [Firmicutes bacterium]|nr:N-acetylmuramoyl-L-alanine amidase [Bacillota bacterium]
MKKFKRLLAILLCFTAFITFNTLTNYTVFAAEIEEEEISEEIDLEETAEETELDETDETDESAETDEDETDETAATRQIIPTVPFAPANAFPQGMVIPAVDMSTEVVTPMIHPTTEVVFVGIPQGVATQLFVIMANSPITNVQRLLLEDNRLAIDILNSTTTLQGAQPIPQLSTVSEVRVSQFEETVTRVVLDLPSGAEFTVTLSSDRQSVSILISQKTLQDLTFSVGENFDAIVLTGVLPANLHIQPGTGVIRFNIPNTTIPTELILDAATEGNFATHINLWQLAPTIVQLAITVNEFTDFTLLQTGLNETTINLHPTTFRNISYNFLERTFTIPRDETNFNITWQNASLVDNYHQRQAVLTLPINANDHLGFGNILITDAFLQSVNIVHNVNNTQLVFTGNQIFSLDLQETDESLVIRVLHPRQRYSRIVVLDPGHGGHDPGASRGAVLEKDLNMRIMQKVSQLIEADPNMRAYTTRNTDVFVPLADRAFFGNGMADIFVSIHHNASNNSAINGIETYFLASEMDQFRTLTSRNLADIMHRNLVSMLNSYDRGVRSANFSVLRNSTIPAVLLELGFMSNGQELARMQTEEFQWQAARAIYNSLLEAFVLVPPR